LETVKRHILQLWEKGQIQRWLLMLVLGVVIIAAAYVSIRLKRIEVLALPFVFLVALQALYNYKVLYYLLFFTIPFSLQLELGPLSIDLPDEPLMILFLLLSVVVIISGKHINWNAKIKTFYIFIFLIIIWLILTTLTSTHVARSIKFLLAKFWYLAAFVFMAELLITDKRSVRGVFWSVFSAQLVVTAIIMVRHAGENFSFDVSHGIVYPIFPNAVVYGAMQALILPWAWMMRTWYPKDRLEHWIIVVGCILILISIVLSYRRGAWVATALLPIVYVLLQFKAFRVFTFASLVVVAGIVGYLLQGNTYYRYAPKYENTVFHHGDFEGHIEATFEGKELSGMERLYRWVAAKNMIADNPWLGTGPSTFNMEYKKYADDAFRTYVSDNPEQSTTHNYFLMTFAEQGIMGGVLFLGICVFMLCKAANVYHTVQDAECKALVLGALLSLVTILFHSILNELIEVDKVGPFFWLSMVMIHKVDVWSTQT